MAKFNSETAKEAGKKGKRGPAKISLTMRQFLFELGELTPRQFVDTYLRLIPFIISQRHLQSFDINEMSIEQVTELVKDIMEQNETN
jgi:hypothetical protein